MLTSSIYVPRQDLSVREIGANKLPLLQLLCMKVLTMGALFVLPNFAQEDVLVYVVSLMVALEFWTAKNMGRRLLHADWRVDSQTGQDRWLFEAQLAAPAQLYEAVFWYSFLMYGLVLAVMLGLSLSVGKVSLACAIAIGVGANAVNFWAFGKIIKLRNNGTLQKLAKEVVGPAQAMEMTVQLPLLPSRSKLG